jgi:ADP-heptose:LPS heptosyltransferase
MRILCLQLKRIGDAILTAPALAAVREAFPLAQVTLVLHGPSGQLAPAFSSADEVMVYKPGRPNVRLWGRIVSGGWSACYDFTGTDRSAVMARMSRATRTFGYRKFAEKRAWRAHSYTDLSDASVRDLHTVDFFLALTGFPTPEDSGFEIPDPKRAWVEGLPDGEFVVVHPGSARAEKLWPAERWARVISQLPLPVVLTGSADPAEQAHLAAILAEIQNRKPEVRNKAGSLTLLELTGVIARARLVLSVDSAAMHLAAMAGRPQVALFGPTNPFHWRPRHSRARVLVAGGDPDEVSPRHQPAAMSELSTERVLGVISEVLRARVA